MKYYLAHPLKLRKHIRRVELGIEALYGLDLLNPFYDVHRPEIEKLDRGETLNDAEVDSIALVEKDLSLLEDCYGVLAVIADKCSSIGTICEMWHAVVRRMPIFVISYDLGNHHWVEYAVDKTGGKIFKTWYEFAAYLEQSIIVTKKGS